MAYRTRPGETQFQARQRIARAKGFGSYRQYRQAGVQAREASTRRLASRDRGYRDRARGVVETIRTRQRARVETGAGVVITSTSMTRLRAELRDHGAGQVQVRAVVSLGGVDRRRRDPRRRHGRETSFRVVSFTAWADDFDTSSVDAFTADLEDAITDQLEQMYAGVGTDWALDSLSVLLATS